MRGIYDFSVVTTSSVPWFTGTSINTMWRAATLQRLGYRVAYVVPWISFGDQGRCFGESRFASEPVMREWLGEEVFRRTGSRVDIYTYPARYVAAWGSIMPFSSPAKSIPPSGVCVLEEPERLFGTVSDIGGVRAAFTLGIIHTNYRYYLQNYGSRVTGPMVTKGWMQGALAASDALVSLSAAGVDPRFPGAIDILPCNGVADQFFECNRIAPGGRRQGAVFIGKLIRAKGLESLFAIASRGGFQVDIYGDGEERELIHSAAQRSGAAVNFLGTTAAPWSVFAQHRVFINPSLSEVLCTTTAEALAAGCSVVLPRHISNEYFESFPNAYFYESVAEAARLVIDLLNRDPDPAEMETLRWENRTLALIGYCESRAAGAVAKRRKNVISGRCVRVAVGAMARRAYRADARGL
jgi:digalactosyldiacylglycerol synthase